MYTIILEDLQDCIELPVRDLNLQTTNERIEMWDTEGNTYSLPAPSTSRITVLLDDALESVNRLTDFYERPRSSTMRIRSGETGITSIENVHMESITWGVSMHDEEGLDNNLEVVFTFFGSGPDWRHAIPVEEELQKLDWKTLGF